MLIEGDIREFLSMRKHIFPYCSHDMQGRKDWIKGKIHLFQSSWPDHAQGCSERWSGIWHRMHQSLWIMSSIHWPVWAMNSFYWLEIHFWGNVYGIHNWSISELSALFSFSCFLTERTGHLLLKSWQNSQELGWRKGRSNCACLKGPLQQMLFIILWII